MRTRFESKQGRFQVLLGLGILACVAVPLLVLELGGCAGGETSGMTCTYLPDLVGDAMFGIYILLVFSLAILWLPILGIVLLVIGAFQEISARRHGKR